MTCYNPEQAFTNQYRIPLEEDNIPMFLPNKNHQRLSLLKNKLFILPNFLTESQCDSIISFSQDRFKKKKFNRHCFCFSSEKLAQQIEINMKKFIPLRHETSTFSHINSTFRVVKYDEGGELSAHWDHPYITIRNEKQLCFSRYSVVVYLNDMFNGGKTHFYEHDGITIIPQTGSCLVLDQFLTHEGQVVTKGNKYILRFDIMYENKPKYQGDYIESVKLWTKASEIESSGDIKKAKEMEEKAFGMSSVIEDIFTGEF